MPRQRIDERGEHGAEHHVGQVLRDLFFVTPAFRQGIFEERRRRARLKDERLAAEQQVERPQPVVALARQRAEVGLEVAAGARPGALIVQPPDAPVGQDTPTDTPVRNGLRGGQVTEDLTVRGAALYRVVAVAAVEREPEAFALFHQQRIPIPFVRGRACRGARLGPGVGEQQMVGDVLVACGSLLRQGIGPSEQGEDRTDEVLFGDRFVGAREPAERLEHAAEAVPERSERARPAHGRAPLGRRADTVGEEVLVNNWPVMASGRSTAFYQRRSASVSPVAWLDTATCFMLTMLTLRDARESFFFPPLPRGERGRTVAPSLFGSSLSNRMNGRKV